MVPGSDSFAGQLLEQLFERLVLGVLGETRYVAGANGRRECPQELFEEMGFAAASRSVDV